MSTSILIDGREFVSGRMTGIGRFLEGLILAIHAFHNEWQIVVGLDSIEALPESLRDFTTPRKLPHLVEWDWPTLARGHDLFLSPYPKLPWRRLPCPSIHTVHDVLYLTHPAYRDGGVRTLLAKMRLQRALNSASLTWFVSSASHKACEELIGGPVPHPAPHLSAIDASFTPGNGETKTSEPFFLYVGNGLPHKNLGVLMRAMSEEPAPLVCVGVRGERVTAYQEKYPNLKQKVTFKQQIDDTSLLQLYRTASALLLPSTAEGFGYPPLEAMACGTPAIVSDIPVLRETTGGVAVYCPPDDEHAWQQAMQFMLDGTVRDEWAERGLQWTRSMRSPQGWHKHIADIEGLVKR